MLSPELLKQQKIELLKLNEEKLRRLCLNSFYNFFCNAWSEIWPGISLRENWHYALLAKEIEIQTKRLQDRIPLDYEVLIVNVPFRTAKSTFFTMCWNAWAWLHDPSLKFISASFNEELSVEHSFRTRKLLDSYWYRWVMKPPYILMTDQNTKSYFENDKGGYRMAISVGRGLGKGGDILIADDPISREDAVSEKIRANTNAWFFETLPTRRNDQKTSLIVLVQQRVHQSDPTGECLQRNGLTYKHFCLPSDIDPGVKVEPKDAIKKYVNGVLFPAAFPREVLVKLKATLGSYTFNAQCRQLPSPPEGGIFNRTWWRFWKQRYSDVSHYITMLPNSEVFSHQQVNLPCKFEDKILSADLNFKRTVDGSFVTIGAWGRVGNDKFLLDLVRERMDYVETKKRLVDFYSHHKDASRFFIEEKANGSAILSDLNQIIPILIGKNPGQESKVERASIVNTSHAVPMSAQCEAGHIYIPHPSEHGWVKEYIEEFAFFPNGSYDDQIDMSTQAINYWNVDNGDLGLYTGAQYAAENEIKENLFESVINV